MSKFEAAIAAFDEVNKQDPNTEIVEGKEYPAELLYAKRMTEKLNEVDPDASEAVRLAAHCQHIERWKIPRNQYPKNRRGYHKWRNALKKYHARRAGEILGKVGYEDDIISRVQSLLLKKKLKKDPEVQLLEDVICLVFLEYYFDDFAEGRGRGKLERILTRTWKKMSSRGHLEVRKMEWPDWVNDLINA